MTGGRMTGVSRRGMMKGGAGALAVATLTPGPLRAATGLGPAVFVFDARFALSRTAAHDHASAGAELLDPRDHDLGVAWRSRFPAVVREGRRIEGLTLWSDSLINQIFAREHGLAFTVAEVAQSDDPAALPLYHWSLG